MSAPETPASLGYRMPAEWAPHRATWLSWPHRLATWQGKFEPIPQVWAKLVETLVESEDVEILAGSDEVFAQASSLVGSLPRVRIHRIPTNDAWMRDHGPTFLVGGPEGGQPALVDWNFNAWGKKYPQFDQDDAVPGKLAEMLDRRRFEPGIVLEGGSIDVNGQGLLLTTEACLLNPNRNPHLNREDIEAYLRDYLNVQQVYWLKDGVAGDDTDGHVDDLTRFVGPRTIVTSVEADPAGVNHAVLEENLLRLQGFLTPDGAPFDIIPLPTPAPRQHNGNPLPASYANFYIANTVVVVPIFNDPADDVALAVLQRLFPDRRVVGLDASDLVVGLGAFHCITQQEPAL